MNYHWIIPLFAAVCSLALAVVVDRKGPANPLSQVFTFLAVALVFWNLNFYVLYSISDYALAFEIARVLRPGAFIVPPLVLHLFVEFRQRKSRWWRHVLAFDYFVAGVLIAANAGDWVVRELHAFAWGYHSVGTRLYDVFSLSLLVNFFGAMAFLVYDYRTSHEPRARVQMKFLGLGALVALPLGLTNLLPTYGVPIYPLGNLGSVAWAAIVAYAIVRHRLLDVDVVVTKGIAYVVVGTLLVVPVFTLSLFMQTWAFGAIHYDFSFALLILFLVIGVLFPTLRARTEARVERSLFPEKQEYRLALREFARTMVRILDRERLLRELARTLSTSLHLEYVAVFILNDAQSAFQIAEAIGVRAHKPEFFIQDAFIRWLEQRHDAILRDEVDGRLGTTSDEAALAFSVNEWEVCVPLFISGKLTGFLGLGRKKSFDAFSVADLELLETLAAESAIALENARLYEELRRSKDIIQRAGRLSALGTLAAGIAHEIRNPLVSIQTFFQLAPQRLHDEEFVTSFLKLTEEEVKRICDLITELLNFAKSPTHAFSEIDLALEVERTLTLLAPQARTLGVSLRHEAGDVPSIVYADGDQVRQVLINVILNGIQATPPGGAVSVVNRQAEHQGGAYCQVEVRDSGSGIPADLRDDIFNPFFTTKDKGTGLGLSIASQIITEHGGFIGVESREGSGSCFLIHLPASVPGQSNESPVGSEFDLPRLRASQR